MPVDVGSVMLSAAAEKCCQRREVEEIEATDQQRLLHPVDNIRLELCLRTIDDHLRQHCLPAAEFYAQLPQLKAECMQSCH